MKPPNLGSGPISLVIPGGNPEDDGGLGGGVDVGGGQAGVGDDTLGAGAAEHADEGELGGRRGDGLGVSLGRGLCRFHCQVHAGKEQYESLCLHKSLQVCIVKLHLVSTIKYLWRKYFETS